jgi:uncharacterized protein (TIGR02246 family)
MRKLIIICLLTIFTGQAYCQSNDIETIRKLNHDWIYSYPTRDTATMSRIFGDDLILISPGGMKMNKQSILHNVMNQTTVSIKIDSADIKLLSPDIGIITAWLSFVTKDNGKNVAARNSYQDVYVKRKGRWYAVAAHVTLLK